MIAKPDKTQAAKIISREKIFDGFHTLEIIRLQPRSLRHDGFAAEMTRDYFSCRPYAAVLLYIPETDEILLNEQFRVGAYMAGADNPFLFECAAGMIDDGETPEQAARRETQEETGCRVLALEPIGSFFTSPGSIDEKAHLFIGRIGRPDKGDIFGMEEEGEEIRTHLFPSETVIAMLDRQEITNVSAAITIHWFARNKKRLLQKWLDQ